MTKLDAALKELRELTKSVWMSKPKDVGRVRGRLGARDQNFTIISYAESDTRAVVDFLHNMRMTAQQSGVNIPTLAAATINLISFEGSRYTRYYDMVDMPKAMDITVEALKEVKTPEEFLAVVEAFDAYIGKVNYWLDLEIPWEELQREFARVRGN